jgi:hypothetical protein
MDDLEQQLRENYLSDHDEKYQHGDGLIDEAVANFEETMPFMDKDELLHHSRDLALMYLALKDVQRRLKGGEKNERT